MMSPKSPACRGPTTQPTVRRQKSLSRCLALAFQHGGEEAVGRVAVRPQRQVVAHFQLDTLLGGERTNGVVLDMLGNVAETCSSTIFLAKDGVVSTPIPNGTFLSGITRHRTIQLLRNAGVKVEERTVKPVELDDADELFTTGNAGKVQPVNRYESRDLQPGPIARQAHELYMAYARTQRVV